MPNALSRLAERSRLLAAIAVAVIAAALAAPAAPSSSQEDSDGNNGTVKVDGVVFDDHPDNEPHPGCVFQIDFYGFDADDEATVNFELQAPTLEGRTLTATPTVPHVVDLQDDPAGGGTDVDAQVTYTLSFTGDPHPQQGYHVKLTVDTGAPGGPKQKVFLVGPCEDTQPTTTTTTEAGVAPTSITPTTAVGGVTEAPPASPVDREATFTG